MINRKKMVKLVCVTSLSVALIFSKGAFAFAAEVPDATDRIKAEETADVVQNFIDTGETGSVIETTEAFVDDSGDVTTTIPKDGNDFITMKDGDGVEIGMSLPEELDTEEGIETDRGTVVYRSNDSADVCVQSITDEQEGLTIDGVRELINIKDADAPKEYTFNFDLPTGYRLIPSEDYWEKNNYTFGTDNKELEIGCIYIIDSNDAIKSVIDPAWAKDGNGNEVETRYTIDGRTLLQTVEFDDHSTFPIIVDPTNHPNKTSKRTMSKAEVKKMRDSYSTSQRVNNILAIFSVVSAIAKPVYGVPYTVATLNGTTYYTKNYALWNKAYVEMLEKGKSKLTMSITYKWHKGKKCYYPLSNSIKLTI